MTARLKQDGVQNARLAYVVADTLNAYNTVAKTMGLMNQDQRLKLYGDLLNAASRLEGAKVIAEAIDNFADSTVGFEVDPKEYLK